MHNNEGTGSWIARHARTTPHKIALEQNDLTLTYAELDLRTRRLARALTERGVGAGDRIAFMGTNHHAALETLFACGQLGAIAVPVHPGLEVSALEQLFEDADVSVVIVTSSLVSTALGCRGLMAVEHRFCAGDSSESFEPYAPLVTEGEGEPTDHQLSLQAPAVLAFSSGTTGRNKGVVLTHRNLLFNAVHLGQGLKYTADDVLLCSAPLYRMGGLGFTLAMLYAGGSCVLFEWPDPERMLSTIESRGVTALFDGVRSFDGIRRSPAFWQRDLTSLRSCVCGGSRVPAELIRVFGRRGLPLQCGYGLTEAAPAVLLNQREEVGLRPDATGRPVFHCDVRVVGPDGRGLEPGQPGELLVRGPNVMSGYWRNPEATSRALLPGGWLRTGDAASMARDGMVSVLGRMSDALYLGDRLIHPGPLEERLDDHFRLAECALVQGAPHAPAHLFVACGPDAFDAQAIRSFCTTEFQLSPDIERVSSLPRNPNGKILRTELRRA